MKYDVLILDLGANDGCSILKFKDILKEQDISNYKIYSFEPNPYLSNKLNLYKNDKIEIINKVAGTNFNKIKFYLGLSTASSSTFEDKASGGIDKNLYFNCEVIDIVDFIKNLPPHDKLWIKMDIEGGEYNLIPYLNNNNCIEIIDKLFIEWHHQKINSISNEQHNNTKQLVKNIYTEEWCALSYSKKNNILNF
jgi:FkbM family methyltransferase